MRHGTFFSGIGAPEHAASKLGWENVFHCELNQFGQRVLKYYFPESDSYSDITTTNFKKYAGTIDVLSGGWPCQDNSNANQSKTAQTGLQGKRSGLFYEFVRGIDEFRPTYVVAENVSNILNINESADFLSILTELAGLGYNAEWRSCFASNIGAPHQRKRIFIVAYPRSFRLQAHQSFYKYVSEAERKQKFPRFIAGTAFMVGAQWDINTPPVCVSNGFPYELDPKAISTKKWIAESIKAYGNSIVTEFPYLIFKGIEELDKIIRPNGK